MKFTINTTTGNWLDKKTLKTGDLIKLTTEATEIPNSKGEGMQVVAKCKVKGLTGDDANISINKPSKNALIVAFGEDSTNWIGKPLTVHTEKTVIAGKRGIAVYLIPEGFEVTEDEAGYVVVSKIGVKGPVPLNGVEYPEEEINPEDIPF